MQYDELFVTVATEKLMTYALGRGVEHRDMPLVRRIAREANNQEGRFSALVLGIVRSQPFQMNQRVDAPSGTTVARATFDNGGAN